MSLKVENLVKTYGANRALDGISFEIGSGEVVGFLGPNGAGKSTSMKIITGCISADSGKVLINGVDISEGMSKLKHLIGYLPENNPLYPGMYVREYLEYSARMYMDQSMVKQAVDHSIEAVGLASHQLKKIGELSKGYRQRAGIARAMVHNPEILILDEPTTGLDPNQIVEIRNLIKELGKQKTVILSTHIMQEAEAVCGRAVIIRKGKIAADDSLPALKERSARNILTVEFDGQADESEILKIPGVLEVSRDASEYRIASCAGADIRRHIFQMAVRQGTPILQMYTSKGSLENIFHELTHDN